MLGTCSSYLWKVVFNSHRQTGHLCPVYEREIESDQLIWCRINLREVGIQESVPLASSVRWTWLWFVPVLAVAVSQLQLDHSAWVYPCTVPVCHGRSLGAARSKVSSVPGCMPASVLAAGAGVILACRAACAGHGKAVPPGGVGRKRALYLLT